MNWGELKAAAIEYINRGDVTASLLTTMLPLVEQRIYNGTEFAGRKVPGLRLMSMLTTVSNQAAGALPSNFISAYRVSRMTGTRPTPLEYRGPIAFARLEGLGTPADIFTIRGGELVLGGTGTSTVELLYFARPTRPVADSDTNVVMSSNDAVYLYGLLWEVSNWLRDSERVSQYAALFIDSMLSAAATDAERSTDGGALVITSDMRVRV